MSKERKAPQRMNTLFLLVIAAFITFEPTSCFQVFVSRQHRTERLATPTRECVSLEINNRLSKNAHDSTVANFVDREDTLVRRSFIASLISSCCIAPASVTLLASNPSHADAASADVESTSSKGAALSNSDVAKRLHNIPTFTIVDKTGVPYFVFGEDAKLTSYFFTTYEEAERILSVAKKSSDKAIAESSEEMKETARANNNGKLSKEDKRSIAKESSDTINPWNEARISVLPLDTAITLATVASSSTGSGVHFQVAPSKQDIEDAMELENINDLKEGIVPIFYFEDFDVPPYFLQKIDNLQIVEDAKDTRVTPLYFQKSQLISDWKRIHPNIDVPQVKTTGLFATLVKMVQPSSSEKDREDLQKLVFISPRTSEQKAKECISRGRNEEPYRLGQRIIVM